MLIFVLTLALVIFVTIFILVASRVDWKTFNTSFHNILIANASLIQLIAIIMICSAIGYSLMGYFLARIDKDVVLKSHLILYKTFYLNYLLLLPVLILAAAIIIAKIFSLLSKGTYSFGQKRA